MAVRRPASPDINTAHGTQYTRFSSYQAEQCAVLVAVLNKHFDMTLRLFLRAGTRSASSHVVTRISHGCTELDVEAFVAGRIADAVAASIMRGDSERTVARVREQEGYIEMRHLLEDIAFLHGVVCIDRVRHTQRHEHPSLAVIAGDTFLFRRDEIARRGFYIHAMLRMMAGDAREFTVRRGNRFLSLMLTAQNYVDVFLLVERMIKTRRDAERAVVVLGGPSQAAPDAKEAVPGERDRPPACKSAHEHAAGPARPCPSSN